jgi:hypothetical protein
MRLRHPALAAIVVCLALAPSAQAAPANVQYSTAGSYTANDCSNQIDCTPTFGYLGTSSCTKNCGAGAPLGGSFALSMSGSVAHPPGPCISKTVQGLLEIEWSNRTTTKASVLGKFNKKKDGYVLKVSVTGGTNTAYPPGPPVKSFVTRAPNACSTGPFVGTLAFRLS